jgi:hypothetical protein
MPAAYSENLAVNNAWDTIRRLSPQTPWRAGDGDPDNAAAGTVIVHGLRCERDGTELGPIGVSRTGACEICGLGRWVAPGSREALDAIAAQEAGPEGRPRGSRRGRR